MAAISDTVRVGDDGRLPIPSAERERLDIKPGDTLVVRVEEGVLMYVKVATALDALADEAMAEFAAGGTISLRAYAAQRGIYPDAERADVVIVWCRSTV